MHAYTRPIVAALYAALVLLTQPAHAANIEVELTNEDAIPRYDDGADDWVQEPDWMLLLHHENGVQISLKLPCLVYETVKNQRPSMQNFIVEAIKKVLKKERET